MPLVRSGLLRVFFLLAAVVTLMLSIASAQNASQSQPSAEDIKKFTAIANHFGQFSQKLRDRVQLPDPRSESHLLPLLPESTLIYAAIPNYGETAHQALTVFREELQTNDELRAWWVKGDMATNGPKIEDGIEKFYQLSQYLGDEVVAFGATEGKEDPKFLFLAEVRKPGLKDFLKQMLKEVAGKDKPAALVFDTAEFAGVKDLPANQPAILVREKFVIMGEDLPTLRKFNAQLERKNSEFAATSFGKRLLKSYEGGATVIAAADMQAVLAHIPKGTSQNQAILERTGFSDMNYLVFDHKNIAGLPASQVELSFTGPRRGIASWLAAPGPMGSLDFVSPKALVAIGLLLKAPAKIYDDVSDLATTSNPNAMASVGQMESALNVSLRNDLFARLTGELTLELDSLPPQDPVWKVILKSKDPSGLLATLRTLLTAVRMNPVEADEDGVSYHSLTIPSGPKPLEISYAIVDGYLLVGSGNRALADSVRLHRNGESLAKSSKLAAAMPPSEKGPDVSALLYEDPTAMASRVMRNISPELADSLVKSAADAPAAAMVGYGEESALREVSRGKGMDFSTAMIVGAIAIPNLLRARIAANEASAVATVRTANTAQITYQATYPLKGYARAFATLGPNPNGSNEISAQHASIIDAALGNPSCTAGAWCVKSGYRFSITTSCKVQPCTEYVVTATPVATESGTRNFCSTSDAVIRAQIGPLLTSPITAAQCRRWPPFMQ